MKCRRPCMIVIATALTSAACGDDPMEPSVAACEPETSTVTATVSSGQSTVFDWEPRCAVAMVLVEEDASDMWLIIADEGDNSVWDGPDEANLIMPPVTYGVVPGGAGILESRGPLPLEAGVTYELVLWRVLPAGSTAQCQLNFENSCLLTVHPFTK